MEAASSFIQTLGPDQLILLGCLLAIVQAGLIAHQSDDQIIDRLVRFAQFDQLPRKQQNFGRVRRVKFPRKGHINQRDQVYAGSPG